MGRTLLDLTLDNLGRAPEEVLQTVYWEMLEDDPGLDARFQKEEWFSATLLEWGSCGKLLVEGELTVGFAQYAPPSLFPRVDAFPAGRPSADAVYLAYCFVAEGHRDRGAGSELIRGVARELVARGYPALESLGEHVWTGGWLLPGAFLEANGFRILRDDPSAALWRLDPAEGGASRGTEAAAAAPLRVEP